MVPNKTIYVSDGDLPSTDEPSSSPATTSRRRSRPPFVAMSTSRKAGVRASTRSSCESGRARVVSPVTGVLLGEWLNSTFSRVETFRVYRGRKGKFVLHIERSPDFTAVDREGKPAGWRGYLGLGDISYGDLAGQIDPRGRRVAGGAAQPDPPRLYDMVAGPAQRPAVEDLDI